MTYIIDANVSMALLVKNHPSGLGVRSWWEGCEEKSVGLCWPVVYSILTQLTSREMMGDYALSPVKAWQVVSAFTQDPRIFEMNDTGQEVMRTWASLIPEKEATGIKWRNAWLVALANSLRMTLVTLDSSYQVMNVDSLKLLR